MAPQFTLPTRAVAALCSLREKLAGVSADLTDFSPSEDCILPATVLSIREPEIREVFAWLDASGAGPTAERLVAHWKAYTERAQDILFATDRGESPDIDEFHFLGFCGVVAEFASFVAELAGPVSEEAEAAAGGGDVKRESGEEPAPPKILANWREILIALGMHNNAEDREKVRRLSQSLDGPIRFLGQGKQPIADHAKLREWWDHLEVSLADQSNQARGVQADGEMQHNWGKTGTAAPGVGGGVKERRSDRKP
jgi:hypothetical protein